MYAQEMKKDLAYNKQPSIATKMNTNNGTDLKPQYHTAYDTRSNSLFNSFNKPTVGSSIKKIFEASKSNQASNMNGCIQCVKTYLLNDGLENSAERVHINFRGSSFTNAAEKTTEIKKHFTSDNTIVLGNTEELIIVGHGSAPDDRGSIPKLGRQTPRQLAQNIMSNVKFPMVDGKPNYNGEIFLDGCHTGEGLYVPGDRYSYASRVKAILVNTYNLTGNFKIRANLGTAITMNSTNGEQSQDSGREGIRPNERIKRGQIYFLDLLAAQGKSVDRIQQDIENIREHNELIKRAEEGQYKSGTLINIYKENIREMHKEIQENKIEYERSKEKYNKHIKGKNQIHRNMEYIYRQYYSKDGNIPSCENITDILTYTQEDYKDAECKGMLIQDTYNPTSYYWTTLENEKYYTGAVSQICI